MGMGWAAPWSFSRSSAELPAGTKTYNPTEASSRNITGSGGTVEEDIRGDCIRINYRLESISFSPMVIAWPREDGRRFRVRLLESLPIYEGCREPRPQKADPERGFSTYSGARSGRRQRNRVGRVSGL